MTAPMTSKDKDWDPFSLLVQEELVERFRLANATITVDRHQAKNSNVAIVLTPNPHLKSALNRSADEQLTPTLLTERIQDILDLLLKDCSVDFGKVIFEIKQGILRKTTYAYSTLPDEPSQSFFCSP